VINIIKEPSDAYQKNPSKRSSWKKSHRNSYIERTERSQINDLMLHFKLLEKEEQAKPKISRRKEIIKIRAKINEMETKKNHTKKKLVL
jgi:hypothetical protein